MAIFKDKMITEMRIRGLTERTQAVYADCMKRFVKHVMIPPDKITPQHIHQYQSFLVNVKKVSWCFFNQSVCAIRFFYNKVLKYNWLIEHIPFQKKDFLCLKY
jgi:integrase/recombinase XerD